MVLVNRRFLVLVFFVQLLLASPLFANPYPPLDPKLPPLVLKSHGIFWAGGEIVNRTQSGTQSVGDLKTVPYNQLVKRNEKSF